MIAQKFTLQFEDFIIVRSSLDVIQTQSGKHHKVFNDYPIDVDYGFKKDGDYIFLFIKISINKTEPPLPGYQIFIEGVGVLKSSTIESLIDANDKVWKHTAIGYCVNQIRGYIISLTSMGSFNQYILPLLDSAHIIQSKESTKTYPQKQPRKSKPAKSKTKK